MGIKEKDLPRASGVSGTDYMREVTSGGLSYKALVADVAKYIVENYNGSSLGGSSRSVKSAIDSLNSKWGDKGSGTAVNDLNAITESGISIIGNTTSNKPATSNSYGVCLSIRSTSSNYMFQLAILNDSVNRLYFRKKAGSETWNEWIVIAS